MVIDVQGYFYPLSGGDQVAAGQYEGTGEGIYMDGTTSVITDVTSDISQEGNFIYGTASTGRRSSLSQSVLMIRSRKVDN